MCINIKMKLLLSLFFFVFTSIYSSSTAQDVQVCVSSNLTSITQFINVNWTFPDDEVRIMFEISNRMINNVYNRTSAIGILFRSNQPTINVTVCRLNSTSPCNTVIAATTPIYNVTWRRVNNRTLEFTCEVACRTPAITGCNINLNDGSGDFSLNNMSTDVIGADEAISSRFLVIVVNDVDPTVEYSYVATPQAIENGVILTVDPIRGVIPALIKVSSTTEQMTPTPSSVPTSVNTSTDIFTTTSSASSTSIPITNSIISTPSNNLTTGANDDGDDNNDDDTYLPVIIAASCTCVLLLVVAVILLIIIIKVKRNGSSSNLSSPSASKTNNYDDLGDVKYFPMLNSQNNMQKSQSPPDDAQNQESHIKKAPGYEFPVFTSVEQNPQVTAGYDSLGRNDPEYDNPNGILKPKSQSNDSPVDPLYNPVTLESAAQPDSPKSPVVEYDRLMHSPTPQAISHFPPSIYDTLSEKNLKDHYEFPDSKDENGTVEPNAQLRRLATSNRDEYTVPQSS